MLRLALKNPDMVFDEGVMSMGEEMESEDNLDFSCLAESLEENLGDKKWAQKLFQKADDHKMS